MKLLELRVQDFRNVALARLELAEPRGFFLGANAQGKTNLLEAVGLLGALRSFRGADARDLVRLGAKQARIWYSVEHERDGVVEVEIVIRPNGREVAINGARCRKLAEFLGRFPVVALSSDDLQLLRGAPQARRRALDLAVAALDEKYFQALQRYQAALEQRNALLRGPRAPAPEELAAFEAQMAPEAVIVVATRATACAELARNLGATYDLISGGAAEAPGLEYLPDAPFADVTEWLALWKESRARDAVMKTTLRGPQRDDFAFKVHDRGAKSFGSEGQQRGLVVAWRMAQVAWQRARTGFAPLVLADDVLGELDPVRRAGFWRA
ncbi:MAG TPA: DNA replication and repair protein RecF, partial [Verrucomicrobiae bacterium]|nr:DNA replication and repair protein RecF [Verrucomicrobiae bacterium]